MLAGIYGIIHSGSVYDKMYMPNCYHFYYRYYYHYHYLTCCATMHYIIYIFPINYWWTLHQLATDISQNKSWQSPMGLAMLDNVHRDKTPCFCKCYLLYDNVWRIFYISLFIKKTAMCYSCKEFPKGLSKLYWLFKVWTPYFCIDAAPRNRPILTSISPGLQESHK